MTLITYSFDVLDGLRNLAAEPSTAVLHLIHELGLTPDGLPHPPKVTNAPPATSGTQPAGGHASFSHLKKPATPAVVLQRTLNRLTAEKYDILLAEFREAHLEAVVSEDGVQGMAKIMFETAMLSQYALDLYARMCRDLYHDQTDFGAQFRYAVLGYCQREFERSLREEGDVASPTRPRAFTNVHFAGSLYMSGMLTHRTVVGGIIPLMLGGGDIGLELLCALLGRIGINLCEQAPQDMSKLLAYMRRLKTSCTRVQVKVDDVIKSEQDWQAHTSTAAKKYVAPRACSKQSTTNVVKSENVVTSTTDVVKSENVVTSKCATSNHATDLRQADFCRVDTDPTEGDIAYSDRDVVFCGARDLHHGDVAAILDDANVVREFRVPRRNRGADARVKTIDGRESHLCEDGVWVSVNWRRRGFDVCHPELRVWVPYHKRNHRYKLTPCRNYEDPSRCAHYRMGRCDFLHRDEQPHTILENILRGESVGSLAQRKSSKVSQP
jgi:hypothetical protein